MGGWGGGGGGEGGMEDRWSGVRGVRVIHSFVWSV